MDPGQMAPQQGGIDQPNISLSAQAELELELSLRGSLLVQQQRRIVQLEDELQRAWAEIERLRSKLGALERERQPNDEDGARQPRYWTPEEHALFVEAVQRYGWKDVKAISQHVGTRNPTQVRTHAQKLLLRQQKEQSGLMLTGPGEGSSQQQSHGQLLALLQQDGAPPAGVQPEQPMVGQVVGEQAPADGQNVMASLAGEPADAGAVAVPVPAAAVPVAVEPMAQPAAEQAC